jgi:hypothetical protein
MNGAPDPVFTSESLSLSWRDDDANRTETVTCWFEREAIRHILKCHVGGDEPWTRIVDTPLLKRFAEAASAGLPPAAADCSAFAQALGRQLTASCRRPMLCKFREMAVPVFGGDVAAARPVGRFAVHEKLLFVLPTGAVAFARITPTTLESVAAVVLLTTFFPRSARGFVAPARAAAAAAARYVQRWAEFQHPSGGRLLPEPGETVRAVDETTGGATQRGQFRFISRESWGFRQAQDGQWVWSWRA